MFVSELHLSDVGLKSTIPSAIGKLTSLAVLDLSKNSLSGTIPTNIGLLSSLNNLDLSNNELVGTLPTTLASLSQLQVLSLYSNQLDGTFPDVIGNLGSLQILQLEFNNFDGRIPSEICDLSNATILLKGNNFACYDSCGNNVSSTTIDYGNVEVCSPTPSPTKPPHVTMSEAYIVVTTVGTILGLLVLAFFVRCAHNRHLEEAKYWAYPVQKRIIDGDSLSEQFVEDNLDSARMPVEGKTALQLLLERISHNKDFDVSEGVLFILVANSLPFDPEKGISIDPEVHNYAWTELVQNDSDICLAVVERILMLFDDQVHLLVHTVDKAGRLCLDIASPVCVQLCSFLILQFICW